MYIYFKGKWKKKALKPECVALLRMSDVHSKYWKAGILTKGQCH